MTTHHHQQAPSGPTQLRLPGQARRTRRARSTCSDVRHAPRLPPRPHRLRGGRAGDPERGPGDLAAARGPLGAVRQVLHHHHTRRGRRALAAADGAGRRGRTGRPSRRWRPSTREIDPLLTRLRRRLRPARRGDDDDARAALAVRLVADPGAAWAATSGTRRPRRSRSSSGSHRRGLAPPSRRSTSATDLLRRGSVTLVPWAAYGIPRRAPRREVLRQDGAAVLVLWRLHPAPVRRAGSAGRSATC